MATCRECRDEVDELVKIKIHGKVRKVCSDCAERLLEEHEIAAESEGVIQGMMGYKGRW